PACRQCGDAGRCHGSRRKLASHGERSALRPRPAALSIDYAHRGAISKGHFFQSPSSGCSRMWSSTSPRGGILSSVHAKKGTTQSSATAQWSLRLKTVTPPDIHQRQTLAEAPPGGLASARPLWRFVSGPVTPSVHDRVRDVALVGVVRPGALHRVGAVAHAHVRRGALTRADPRALVTVFLARELVGPAAGRILVGHGFGVLVTVHDREAIESSGRAAVDEILTAACAEIGDVREVGEGRSAVRG